MPPLTLQQIIAAQKAKQEEMIHAPAPAQAPAAPQSVIPNTVENLERRFEIAAAAVAEPKPVQPGIAPAANATNGIAIPRLGLAVPKLGQAAPPASPVVAATPGLKVRLPVAAPDGGRLLDSHNPSVPPGSSVVASWDSLELGDFEPVLSQGSSAAAPNYSLPQDHTPIPPRDVPSDATPQQLEFIQQLDSLYGLHHDAELFSQVIRNLMIEMKEDPAMEEFVSDDDIRVMVKGMRESLGVARQQKQARAKSPTAKGRKAGVKSDESWDNLIGGALG